MQSSLYWRAHTTARLSLFIHPKLKSPDTKSMLGESPASAVRKRKLNALPGDGASTNEEPRDGRPKRTRRAKTDESEDDTSPTKLRRTSRARATSSDGGESSPGQSARQANPPRATRTARAAVRHYDAGKSSDSEEDSEEEENSRALRPRNPAAVEESSDNDHTDGEGSEADLAEELEEGGHESGVLSFSAYFEGHGRSSDNRLSSLPLLEHKDYVKAIRGAPMKHRAEVEQGLDLHAKSFPEWHFQLQEGFNLCFYGLGSKRKLLTAFAEAQLRSHPVVIVNGFLPSASMKVILAQIITKVIQPIEGSKGSVPPQVDDAIAVIAKFFARDEERRKIRLFVVIHNIDGEQLRSIQAQNALSQLADIPNVGLICSVDHINAPLLWDAARKDKLSFVWHDVTTFEPYDVETSMAEDSGLINFVGGEGNRTLNGMKHVMRSLPVNARRVFRVLAEHQLSVEGGEGSGRETQTPAKRGAKGSRSGPGPSAGLSLQIYRRKCEDLFIPGTGSDVTFRAQLREFTDHKLMEQTVTSENGEVVFISMETQMLKDLLAAMAEL